MNYAKPEITGLASASSVIQGAKQTYDGSDSNLGDPKHSIAAYECDE